MQPFRLLVIAVTAVAVSVLITPAAEAQIPRAPLALEPIGATGEAIWPAFESWTRNEDGTVTMVMGYMNRNEEIVEIPIGEDNSMGPGVLAVFVKPLGQTSTPFCAPTSSRRP